MNENALKLKNKDLITRFKENLDDTSIIAEFMPKNVHDILAAIHHWEARKMDANYDPEKCTVIIKELENLMISGINFATDMMVGVATVQPMKEEKTYPSCELTELDRDKLPTLAEIIVGIESKYRDNGEKEARAYAHKMLQKNRYKEGCEMIPNAINGLVDDAIKKVKATPMIGPVEKTVETAEKSVEKKQLRNEFEELKKRYPSLSEDITDDECKLIDAYDKVILKKQKLNKKEELRFTSAQKEYKDVIEKAGKEFVKMSEKKQENITKNAIKKYNSLSIKEKEDMSQAEYVIHHYASTLPDTSVVKDKNYLKRHPLLDILTTKDVIEEEAKAMKDIQEIVSALYKDEKGADAQTVAKIFFGDFGGTNLWDIQKGRGWSDKEVFAWTEWVRKGCAKEEWHLYSLEVKKEDAKYDEKVKEIKENRDKLKIENSGMSEQLKTDLVAIMEKNLNDDKELKITIEEYKEAYKQHTRPWNLGEINTLYKVIKGNFKKEKITNKVEKNQTTTDPSQVFNRQSIPVDSELYQGTKPEDIKTLGDLHKIITKIPDWRDALNTCLDLIVENKQISDATGWNVKRVEDWFHKFVKATEIEEEIKEKKDENTESEIKLIPVEALHEFDKIRNKNPFKRMIGDLLKQYGTEQRIKRQIADKIRSLTEGWPAVFNKQPPKEIYQFILGIQKKVIPKPA